MSFVCVAAFCLTAPVFLLLVLASRSAGSHSLVRVAAFRLTPFVNFLLVLASRSAGSQSLVRVASFRLTPFANFLLVLAYRSTGSQSLFRVASFRLTPFANFPLVVASRSAGSQSFVQVPASPPTASPYPAASGRLPACPFAVSVSFLCIHEPHSIALVFFPPDVLLLITAFACKRLHGDLAIFLLGLKTKRRRQILFCSEVNYKTLIIVVSQE